ncbi:MAG: glycosyltransferase [Candidatus Glassbacteria bacterium]
MDKNSGKHEEVSFISTFREDEAGVKILLDSLIRQTKLPDEVVLVDGGSPASTLGVLEEFASRARQIGIETQILVRPGCNIAEGRNAAIERASFGVIASSDAGCILDASWLEEITSPFSREEVEMVSGTYRPQAASTWERAVAAFLMPDPDRVAESIPSARSVAFRKSVWEAVGGFPEILNHGEDTYFSLRAKQLGVRTVFTSRALVRWRPRRDAASFFKQILLYSIGDATVGISIGYYVKKMTLFVAGLLMLALSPSHPHFFLILLALLGATLWLLYRRVPGEFKDPGVILLLLPVCVIHLTAQSTGFIIGSLKRALSAKGPPPPGRRFRAGQR